MLLGAAACSRSAAPAQSPSITIPPEFKPRPVHAARRPLNRGTIRLGEIETGGAETEEAVETAEPAGGNVPTATGGGPRPFGPLPYGASPSRPAPAGPPPSGTSDIGPIEGSQDTSVGPMSPSTVTGTKSPSEPAKPAAPAR